MEGVGAFEVVDLEVVVDVVDALVGVAAVDGFNVLTADGCLLVVLEAEVDVGLDDEEAAGVEEVETFIEKLTWVGGSGDLERLINVSETML